MRAKPNTISNLQSDEIEESIASPTTRYFVSQPSPPKNYEDRQFASVVRRVPNEGGHSAAEPSPARLRELASGRVLSARPMGASPPAVIRPTFHR